MGKGGVFNIFFSIFKTFFLQFFFTVFLVPLGDLNTLSLVLYTVVLRLEDISGRRTLY